MNSLPVVAMAGLLAGAIHVLAGPDHLAAVAPLAVEQRRRPWSAGLRWGLGHASGVLIVACLAMLLRDMLPLEALSSWSERLVGLVLIAIGFWGLRKALRHRLHAHEHVHNGEFHRHVHAHDPRQKHENAAAHAHTHLAMAIGVLHGLAGSSHFLGVLPALAMPTQSAAAYLIAFAAGTIAAMAGFSTGIGYLGSSMRRGGQLYQGLMTLCSLAAIGIGGFWLVS